MATWRQVWEFVEGNGSSFSEIFYFEAGNIGIANVLTAKTRTLRLNHLNKLNTFRQVRTSNVLNNRETDIIKVNRVGTSPSTLGPLAPGAAIVCGLGGEDGGRRQWWMRGCDRADYVRDPVTGLDNPGDLFRLNFKNLVKSMADDRYGILRIKRIGQDGTAYYRITSADGTAVHGSTVLTVQAGHNFVLGDTIIISQASKKDLPALNGRFTVTFVAGNLVTINYATPDNRLVPMTTGRAKKLAYQPVSVFDPDSCDFSHLGTRDTKSPLSRSRGSRRATRLRSQA